MPGSGKKVNYSLRPAKQIERKMICEAIRQLSPFGKVKNYRYVGMGSFYFSDFILFHKALEITDMVSIESDPDDYRRCVFNSPFDCIKVRFGHSTEVLSKLAWDNVRTVLWLDYDYKLDGSVLDDISFFCASACSGSVLLVTVDAHIEPTDRKALNGLISNVGKDNVPPDVRNKDLRGWGSAKVARRIINNRIAEILNSRNGDRESGNCFVYKQLFNFSYSDGTRMTTVGGLLFDEGQFGLTANCGFDDLTFVRTGDEPYLIEVPKLTYRELRYLDQSLPVDSYERLKTKTEGIPDADLKAYSDVYRWFPTFAETDL
jgi:putative O-methyltransferase